MKKCIQLFQVSLISLMISLTSNVLLVHAGWPTFSGDTFEDVDAHDFYRGDIIVASAQKIIVGYPDGSFKPEQSVNRAEYIKMILLSANLEILAESNCFSDVNEEWFANYVCTAKEMGLVEGYPDGKFYPEQTINLAEASKIFSKAWALEVNMEETENWYKPYIKAIEDLDVLPPTITTFDEPLTRAEITKLVSYKLERPWYSYLLGNEASYDSIISGNLKGLILQGWWGRDRVYFWNGETTEYLGFDAALSPSEEWVAAVDLDEEKNRYQLKIINSVTGEEILSEMLSEENIYYSDIHFFWSNDGQKLALNLINDENEEGHSIVYIFDVVGKREHMLQSNFDYECSNGEVESIGCWTKDLVWSADDEKLLFLSQFPQDEEISQQTDVFTILSSEGEILGEVEEMSPYSIQDYRWSEDGEEIIYTYWDAQLNEKKEVYTDITYYGETPRLSCTHLEYYTDNEAFTDNEALEWKEALESLYPTYAIEDIGGKCEMSNGDTLLSFAYSDETGGAQQVILFDQELNVLKETTPASIRKTSGGLTAPYLESRGEDVEFIFRDGDGPCGANIRYKLDLETFEYFYSSITSVCS